MIAGALLNRAFALGSLERYDEEIAGYDTAIEYIGQQDKADGRTSIALAFKALRLAETGYPEEALAASASLEREFGDAEEDWGRAVAWIGLAARAVALAFRQEAGWISACRTTYARFPADRKFMTGMMIRLVLNLVAVGAREEELAEVLAEDRGKTRSIAPLVVALSRRCGEPVRAPAEVLEVAADIRKALDEKSAKGILRAF